MVNAGLAVGRRRAFVKDIRRGIGPCRHRLMKGVIGLPEFQNFLIDIGEIKLLVFLEFLSHSEKIPSFF